MGRTVIPPKSRQGVTILELMVVLAIVGILAAIGYSLLPRQGMAVSQGQRILATAIQFARLEAIKQNTTVEVDLADGAHEVVVRRADDSSVVLRRFAFDPQGSRVVVKDPPDTGILFNSRGVAAVPLTRTLRLGIAGSTDYDVALQISGQGSLSVVEE